MRAIGRYLVDYENPDAGIGHSLGHVNNAVKICMRHGLTLAYSESQVQKSSKNQLRWRLRQWLRRLTFRQVYETHDIGNDINKLFAFSQFAEDRNKVERLIRNKKLKVVLLPETAIHIPSNEQQDDVAYAAVDSVIRSYPEDGVVFRLPNKRTGDFEYEASRDWFRRSYAVVSANDFLLTGTSAKMDALKVAVHIRRGDLLPGRQFDDLSKRMLPDAWYLQIVDAIIRASAGRPLVIYIVSEGRDGMYCSEKGIPMVWRDILQADSCQLIELIDSPFVESFRVLVGADILVGSKSGMTHLAGMLGEQTKIVPRMWHSYRGASPVLELGDAIHDHDLLEIAHLTVAQWLRRP